MECISCEKSVGAKWYKITLCLDMVIDFYEDTPVRKPDEDVIVCLSKKVAREGGVGLAQELHDPLNLTD